ncbi:MAG: ATP-binding protein [Bacteroidota bacterium]
MNSKYIIGIAIAVLVLTANQLFIQYSLSQKKYDAQKINIAGKQRMLSQKIDAEFYKIYHEGNSTEELDKTFQEWETAHQYLLQEEINSKNDNAIKGQIKKSLEALNPMFAFIKQQKQYLGNAAINLTDISKNQQVFLKKMDDIVKLYENDSDKKLSSIVMIEYSLYFLSLLIIILEVIYIYVPIEKLLKNANKEISDKNAELKSVIAEVHKKNEELEEITYITSHDLQEPLRTINSLINVFKTKYSASFDATGIKMMEFLDGATIRMQQLIKDLLEYSIIGKDQSKITVDCNRVMQDIVKDLFVKIEQTNATINWSKLPTIIGFPAEIRLLFQNLISNALKFQKEGVNPHVTIQSAEHDNHWEFSVSDNGIGMEEKHLDKIFSIFQRLHSKDTYEGTGIGLAHCTKIVDIHGGKIWVTSELGKGSTFYFTIEKRTHEIDE